jgi:hypothetical protein
MTSTELFALSYLSRRWSVIPIKQPQIQWEPFQRRLPREAEMREQFGRWRSAGVAVETGATSRLIVIDVDVQHSGDQALAAQKHPNDPLPRTA